MRADQQLTPLKFGLKNALGLLEQYGEKMAH